MRTEMDFLIMREFLFDQKDQPAPPESDMKQTKME